MIAVASEKEALLVDGKLQRKSRVKIQKYELLRQDDVWDRVFIKTDETIPFLGALCYRCIVNQGGGELEMVPALDFSPKGDTMTLKYIDAKISPEK